MPTPASAPIVFVVDDDESVREALASLVRSAGMRVEVFASAQGFLSRPPVDAPGCLVLDVRLQGDSARILTQLLARLREIATPAFRTAAAARRLDRRVVAVYATDVPGYAAIDAGGTT